MLDCAVKCISCKITHVCTPVFLSLPSCIVFCQHDRCETAYKPLQSRQDQIDNQSLKANLTYTSNIMAGLTLQSSAHLSSGTRTERSSVVEELNFLRVHHSSPWVWRISKLHSQGIRSGSISSRIPVCPKLSAVWLDSRVYHHQNAGISILLMCMAMKQKLVPRSAKVGWTDRMSLSVRKTSV